MAILGADRKRALIARGRRALAEARVQVVPLMHDVRDNGDAALARLAGRGGDLLAGPWERKTQARKAPRRERLALESAAKRIRAFHAKQAPRGVAMQAQGLAVGWTWVALDRVGITLPGASGLDAVTLLMTAIPARLAGVGEIVACVPPRADGTLEPLLAAAAEVAEVDRVFRIGGPAGVFAMAYGTAQVPRVDRVVGPGDVRVQAAKQLVQDLVGVDLVAGAGEVLVLADGSAPAAVAAWELAAAAERAPDATAVLMATSEKVRASTEEALAALLPGLARGAEVARTLERHGALLSVPSLGDALAFANEFAPENLVLLVRDPRRALGQVRHAGTVHLGPHTPAALAAYGAAPNHVLPTAGSARFRSPLGVADFGHAVQWQQASPAALARLAPDVEALASHAGREAAVGSLASRAPGRNGGRPRRRS